MKHGRSLSYDEAWEEGRNTASQNIKSADGTMQSEKNTASEGGVVKFSASIPEGTVAATREESKKLSITDPKNIVRYLNEVNAALAETMKSGDLVLIGMPNGVLSKYLQSSDRIYIPQNIVRKIVFGIEVEGGKHNLGRAVAEGLPYQLEDPIAITGNTSDHIAKNDKSIVVWTNWMTKSGDSIIIPIRIGVMAKGQTYNNVNSVFDVFNEGYAADLLRDGNILYTKENRNIQELLATQRKVLEGKQSDVSNNSIRNDSEKIKMSDEKYFSIAEKYRDGTETEEETEQLRKMVDEGSNSDFAKKLLML